MAKSSMRDLVKRRVAATQQASELQTSDEAYAKLFQEAPPVSQVAIQNLPLDKLVPFVTADIGFKPYPPAKLKAFAEQLNAEGLIIIKVDREAGYAIASRRMAARSQRYFFARRPALHRIGARIKCRMLSVGPRRCLVECYGHDIGLTQRELRYTAIPDLRDAYRPGEELDCIVKSFDADTAALRISVKETESNPFEGAAMRHPVGSSRLAVIAGKYGGGVFCNLPDGTVCMCSYSYQHEDSDFLIGDSVMLVVQRYDAEKQQMYGKILSKR